MRVIEATNPDQALQMGLQAIENDIDTAFTDSRNGPVVRFKGPVVTEWIAPHQRVSFNPTRDANPFMHLIESMWMLAGRNDVDTIGYYAKQLREYTDDGVTLNGAYGHRWRHHFGYDQLDEIVAELKKNPQSRRCVLSMWNAFFYHIDSVYEQFNLDSDLINQGSKDLPCNLQVLFDLSLGKLDMTVTNRSNDMIWGAYGANAVHFAFLQEYVANRIGCKVGTYYQMSNNLHVYLDFPITKRFLTYEEGSSDLDLDMDSIHYSGHYRSNTVASTSLEAYSPHFEEELQRFVDNCRSYTIEWLSTRNFGNPLPYQFENRFLNNVALPMAVAYNEHKNGDTQKAREYLCQEMTRTQIYVDAFGPNASHIFNDWLMAGLEWLDRRIDKNQPQARRAD